MNERDRLREKLVARQDNLCAICGHGMHGDAQVHEAIIKRSDLPGDKRVFEPINCVAIHAACHENTRQADEIAIRYLKWCYNSRAIMAWIESLGMVTLPARAKQIKMEIEQNE